MSVSSTVNSSPSFPVFCLHQAPVLVIGSGVAGLLTALKLAKAEIHCLLVTKTYLAESNTRYAQGGIAAVLPHNTADSIELHVQDTLQAGAGLCNEAVVRSLLAEGAAAIDDLLELGVAFDKEADNTLALTKEAAHSVRRIVHAGGDATGDSVETRLVKLVKASPFIEVLEHTFVTRLCKQPTTGMQAERVTGAWAVLMPNPSTTLTGTPLTGTPLAAGEAKAEQRWLKLQAAAVVLATGGLGQLYSHTTNPAIATGDGVALAIQAGAKVEGLEFVQFHPTGFYHNGKTHFLISEAFRGEGGRLKNSAGEFFASRYHVDAELAPRDVVCRAIFSELQKQQVPHVWLDMMHLPHEWLPERFPSIHKHLLANGVDMRTQPIPVAPAAHYAMGGVAVTPEGQTSIEGLYAVGEVAHTGLHGANRLASNSLLECLVLARRVAAMLSLAPLTLPLPSDPTINEGGDAADSLPAYSLAREKEERNTCIQALRQTKAHLQRVMWQYVGVIRTQEGLQQAHTLVTTLQKQAATSGWEHIVPQGLELVHLLGVAQAVIEAAQRRPVSIGAHYLT